MNLKPHADLWIGEQVMDPNRRGKQQEHDEGEPAHGVAVEPSACGLRHQRIESDIGRHQPEIDDGMQRDGEERARQSGIDLTWSAQMPAAGRRRPSRARRRSPTTPKAVPSR